MGKLFSNWVTAEIISEVTEETGSITKVFIDGMDVSDKVIGVTFDHTVDAELPLPTITLTMLCKRAKIRTVGNPLYTFREAQKYEP